MAKDNWKNYKEFKTNSELTAAYYQLVAMAFETGIKQTLSGRRCCQVVDLGCGSGELTRTLRTYADHVIGIDSSPGLIEEALADPDQEGLRFVVGDVLDAAIMGTLATDAFDLVAAAWLHNHLATVEAQEQLLQTVARLMSAEGSFVFLIPSDAFTSPRSQRFIAQLGWQQAWLDEQPEYNRGVYKFGDSDWTEMTVWQPMWLAQLYSSLFEVRFLDVKQLSIGHQGLGQPPIEPTFEVMIGTRRGGEN